LLLDRCQSLFRNWQFATDSPSLRGLLKILDAFVAQTQKKEVRRAILDAARYVFSEHGYSNASISHIAKRANVSPANVYVYFRSKLDILFAIYDPWLIRQFDELERALARIDDPAKRLKKILSTLWRDIPSADNGFANNMMQALSTTTAREGYKPTLRFAAEKRLARMLEECLPNFDRSRVRDLAATLFMAFDGYILNFHLSERATCPTGRFVLLADILLSYERQLPSRSPARRSVSATPGRAGAPSRAVTADR
jgi:AcrR family transcriptional regulator